MHPLKSAVLHHKLDEISSLAADPEIQSDATLGKDLLRIAREMGNTFTIARVARVLPNLESAIDARALLRNQLRALAPNYFGGGSPEQAAHRAWVQLTQGTVEPRSEDKPEFVLAPEHKEDMRFLLRLSGIESEEHLVALARAAE